MFHKSKIKLAAVSVISLSVLSLLVHLYLASSSSSDSTYQKLVLDDLFLMGQNRNIRKLWGPVNSLEALRPHARPRSRYSVPSEMNNGYIFAKIYGGFEKIQSSICDVVTISRLLNATLVIPELQESVRSKGISSMFKSFSYLYNEEKFIEALANDVIVIKSLPKDLKEARRQNKIPILQPERSASPSFYINEVLPKLKIAKAIGLVITGGGCLQSILPPDMVEYQRLRCRVAFHSLHFRPDIEALGNQMVNRLRQSSNRPYLVYHPGLVRETLAFHGCAELFQDVHSELVQYQRSQMIKRGIIHEDLSVDSMIRRRNGTCPLMPEEVGLLLRAVGYPPNTIIYLAGSQTFGGQRILIPLRGLYINLLDRTSLCSQKDLAKLIGHESPLPPSPLRSSPVKSEKELSEEWKKAGPRPRPLPPPPSRPFYEHEKEGWYGWIAESDKEPEPTHMDLRMQAHRLLWDALDYYVSVEADAFFPGFNNDGSGWPDFSSLVMGHRLYKTSVSVTFRPDRKTITKLFDTVRDHMYYAKRNWTVSVRDHLSKSVGVEGLVMQSQMSKPMSFISHPFPECSCSISKSDVVSAPASKGTILTSQETMDECPEWMMHDIKQGSVGTSSLKDNSDDSNELPEYGTDIQGQSVEKGKSVSGRPSEQDEEMDPDD